MPGVPTWGISYLRQATAAAMVDTIKVLTPNVPVYDTATGRATGSTHTAGYVGKAHIHPSSPDGTLTLGDGVEAMALISVTVPYDISPVPSNGDHVVVTAVGASSDASLVGETLRIINVSGGGIGYITRTFTCTFAQANPFDPSA